MKPTRRDVLAGLAASPVLACGQEDRPDSFGPDATPERPPEPEPWVADGTIDAVAFPFVAAGDATEDGILLATRTGEPVLGLVVVGQDGADWVVVAERELAPLDGSAQIVITGLAADRAHRYVFTTPDGRRSEVGRFRTAGGDRVLVFGATSCLGRGDPTFASLASAATDQLDFFCFLGDTVYADGNITLDEYRAEWARSFAVPALRDLLASTSVVAAWDDHEVANNWVLGEGNVLRDGVTEEQVEAATTAFREHLPQRIDGPTWRALTWGETLELLVLDCRGERAENALMSEAQLSWVVDRIRTSPARFRVVLTSVHVTDHTDLFSTAQAEDRWQGYPSQRDTLIAAAEDASGVLFVTGDMHFGALQQAAPEGQPGDGLWEVAAGPAGSAPLPVTDIAALQGGPTAQYAELAAAWNWARFTVDPGAGTIRVQLVGVDGIVLADRLLTA